MLHESSNIHHSVKASGKVINNDLKQTNCENLLQLVRKITRLLHVLIPMENHVQP